ncbi:hypothetical protein [Salinigranum salinum]|uniref:hypothetical protein n=1 Tax=Salinigranum salinum TaxID=1364937 RepID=UPI0012604AF3|nr:hypothetical protein [Salinigranum salinum]
MKRTELTVQGEDAWKLPRAVRGSDWVDRFDYGGDGWAVIVVEQYFSRTVSALQTTVVFELVDETTTPHASHRRPHPTQSTGSFWSSFFWREWAPPAPLAPKKRSGDRAF